MTDGFVVLECCVLQQATVFGAVG